MPTQRSQAYNHDFPVGCNPLDGGLAADLGADMQASQEQLQKKNQEIVDLYRDKCKKFTQITNLYNLLKSRAMRSQLQTAASDTVSSALNIMGRPGNAPPVSAPTTLLAASVPPQTPTSFPQNAFPVNQDGVEQIHRHQRSGTGSSKKAKSGIAAMPPPGRPLGITRNRKFLSVSGLRGY